MKMRALQAFTYDQQDLKPGDIFNTKTNLHAQIFVQSRKAEYAETEKQTRSLKAEDDYIVPHGDEESTEAPHGAKAPRRGRPRKVGNKVGAITSRSGLVHRYRRTDLEAEDS